MYLLDTDTVSYYLKHVPSVVARLEACASETLHIGAPTVAELLYGAYRMGYGARRLRAAEGFFQALPVLGFEADEARVFARTKTLLEKRGKRVADMDLILASIALTHGLTLVTNNTRHFRRVEGLEVVNWVRST